MFCISKTQLIRNLTLQWAYHENVLAPDVIDLNSKFNQFLVEWKINQPILSIDGYKQEMTPAQNCHAQLCG